MRKIKAKSFRAKLFDSFINLTGAANGFALNHFAIHAFCYLLLFYPLDNSFMDAIT
jgi:hypothetical protein